MVSLIFVLSMLTRARSSQPFPYSGRYAIRSIKTSIVPAPGGGYEIEGHFHRYTKNGGSYSTPRMYIKYDPAPDPNMFTPDGSWLPLSVISHVDDHVDQNGHRDGEDGFDGLTTDPGLGPNSTGYIMVIVSGPFGDANAEVSEDEVIVARFPSEGSGDHRPGTQVPITFQPTLWASTGVKAMRPSTVVSSVTLEDSYAELVGLPPARVWTKAGSGVSTPGGWAWNQDLQPYGRSSTINFTLTNVPSPGWYFVLRWDGQFDYNDGDIEGSGVIRGN